ncbi:hypothetical protein [Klebsiella sp. RIT-PI-d]|uniref:hypothetical protein n=1 Tax=Klebsiella sp. RIT-PI-d TaxID=1681196 RepID=UPI003A100836
METVVRVFHSYPTFLWITWCKILFIASDQIWKTFFQTPCIEILLKKNIYKSESCCYRR